MLARDGRHDTSQAMKAFGADRSHEPNQKLTGGARKMEKGSKLLRRHLYLNLFQKASFCNLQD